MSCNRRAAAVLAATLLFVDVALAQQAPTAPQTPSASAPAPAAEGKKAAGAKPPAADKPDSKPPPSASKSTPQRFEPTEKVRPDFDVAFPVDI